MPNESKWAELYHDVRQFKAGLPDDAEIKHRGFSIFFAPPQESQVLIIGLNPSRSDASYAAKYPESETSFPVSHLYGSERGGKLGKALEAILLAGSSSDARAGSLQAWQDILRGTKINLFFFGSRNWTEWCKEDFWGIGGRDLRLQVEERCVEWVVEIIHALTPNRIICEGFAVYDRLKHTVGTIGPDEVSATRPGRGNQRLYTRGNLRIGDGSIPVLSILHPTGGRGRTADETTLLGKEIISFLGEK